MSSGRAGEGAGSAPSTQEQTPPWGRRLAVVTAVVYVVSGLFPLVAGLSHHTDSLPSWWGAADVGVAFVLAVLAFAIFGFGHGRIDKDVEQRSYTLYRILIHVLFGAAVAFFLFGDRIIWSNCLTGLGWRYWLLLYGLPAWLAAFAADSTRSRRVAEN